MGETPAASDKDPQRPLTVFLVVVLQVVVLLGPLIGETLLANHQRWRPSGAEPILWHSCGRTWRACICNGCVLYR